MADPTPAAPKVTILDLILFCESELESIDSWERVLCAENKPLYPRKAKDRILLRKMVSLLEIVKIHERAIALLEQKRHKNEATTAALPGARRGSTERLPAPSTPENVPSGDDTEQSPEQ